MAHQPARLPPEADTLERLQGSPPSQTSRASNSGLIWRPWGLLRGGRARAGWVGAPPPARPRGGARSGVPRPLVAAARWPPGGAPPGVAAGGLVLPPLVASAMLALAWKCASRRPGRRLAPLPPCGSQPRGAAKRGGSHTGKSNKRYYTHQLGINAGFSRSKCRVSVD